MGDTEAGRISGRMPKVQEDWLAWLPEEKDLLFDATLNELEVSYIILSVALNDGFTLCQQGRLLPAREQAGMFANLFDRLAGGLRGVLRTLDEHGRCFGTLPNVAPLQAEFFRSERAQQSARTNLLLSVVLRRGRKRYFRKLEALIEIISVLQEEAQAIAAAAVDGTALYLIDQWTRLEILHYDLNTCLRETSVVLKSFFCVLPTNELPSFRTRLLSQMPPTLFQPRRTEPFLTKMVTASGQPAGQSGAAMAADLDDSARAGQDRSPMNHKDNSRSRERIPSSRVRPDGSSGSNETN